MLRFVKREMSPRPYQLGRRRAAAEKTRARVLAAARELLIAREGIAAFTVDAVARRAGVARMTIYYQFESKHGLLEALCDSLALAGGMEGLVRAFKEPQPEAALDVLVAVFCRFWASDRELIRRLQGLSALDADFAQVLAARDGRRREALQVLVRRVRAGQGRPEVDLQPALDLLYALTSFETFDALARPERELEEAVSLIQALTRAALELPAT